MTKKALIQGTRICQIEDTTFEVHSDLKWVDVADNTTTQDTYSDGAVVKFTVAVSEYWKGVRSERSKKLSDSDWTVANDTPLSDSDKAKWVKYRKSLRDLPGTLNDTTVKGTITWPTEPS